MKPLMDVGSTKCTSRNAAMTHEPVDCCRSSALSLCWSAGRTCLHTARPAAPSLQSLRALERWAAPFADLYLHASPIIVLLLFVRQMVGTSSISAEYLLSRGSLSTRSGRLSRGTGACAGGEGRHGRGICGRHQGGQAACRARRLPRQLARPPAPWRGGRGRRQQPGQRHMLCMLVWVALDTHCRRPGTHRMHDPLRVVTEPRRCSNPDVHCRRSWWRTTPTGQWTCGRSRDSRPAWQPNQRLRWRRAPAPGRRCCVPAVPSQQKPELH